MPNSLVWIGLVVVWVFVLFPILADRHPRIRQTTDAALATRVLHRGGSKRRMKSGPAAGHDSDPDYRPTRTHRKLSHSDESEDRMTTSADEPVTEADDERSVDVVGDDREYVVASAGDETLDAAPDIAEGEPNDAEPRRDSGYELESAEPDLELDTEPDTVAADSAARTELADDDDEVAEEQPEPTGARTPPARSSAPARITDADTEDTFENDGFAAEFELSDDPDFVPTRRGRGGFDPEADAIARAARYTFRQRSVLALVLGAIAFGALGVAVSPLFWWAGGLTTCVLVGYLAYLRKQVTLEEEIRRRRSARLSRTEYHPSANEERARVANQQRQAMDRDTARALRRRSILLETDDEDPMFEHLDPFDPATARALRERTGGPDMRRAAGE